MEPEVLFQEWPGVPTRCECGFRAHLMITLDDDGWIVECSACEATWLWGEP